MKNALKLGAIIALFAVGLVYTLAGITNVDPGEEAIVIKKIGDDKGMQTFTLDTGIHFFDPFIYDIDIYDVRFHQETVPAMEASTRDGQPITIDVSFEIGLIGDKVPELHETVGHDYYEQVVYPKIRRAIRYATSTQLSDEIYQGAGRIAVQKAINESLKPELENRGILIDANVRDIRFQNKGFVQTLEQKAEAAQKEIIEQRLANAAVEQAKKMANLAEGEKQKRIKAAEAVREERRLEGEGERLKKEEEAAGILAIALAEAKGIQEKNKALQGPGGQLVRDIEVLGGLGERVQFYGVPTGAPGTSTYIIDKALKGKIAVGD